MVNGSPDATWDGRLAYSPPRDAVSEVRVKAFDSDAAYGHTGGGTLNQVLKSGTNQFHGTVSEANQPNNLTANNFFNNKAGIANPVTHYNQYGATIGGPLWIPKVYNGKDKLFWFFAWGGLKDSQPNTTFLTVPTAKEAQGDFSDLLKAGGSSYQLYSPYSGDSQWFHDYAFALCQQCDSHQPVEPHRSRHAQVLPDSEPDRNQRWFQ